MSINRSLKSVVWVFEHFAVVVEPKCQLMTEKLLLLRGRKDCPTDRLPNNGQFYYSIRKALKKWKGYIQKRSGKLSVCKRQVQAANKCKTSRVCAISQQAVFVEDISKCHSRKSTGANDKVNDG